MTDKKLFHEAEETLKECNQPYKLDILRVRKSLLNIQAWQSNPSNDCLRARGDNRWIKSCELATSLQLLLEPF